MIRFLLALLFNQLTIALRRRLVGSVGSPTTREEGPRGVGGAVVEVSVKPPSCACLLREFLNRYHITTHDLAEYGIPRRLALDIRAGVVVPNDEQKLLIFNAAADKHSRRQQSPRRFGYDDIFGENARPRICSCEVRQLLTGLSRDAVATALCVSFQLADDLIVRWRAGLEKPSDDQLSILRKLADGAEIVSFVPRAAGPQVVRTRFVKCEHDTTHARNLLGAPPARYCCIPVAGKGVLPHQHICGRCARFIDREFYAVEPIAECDLESSSARRQA